MTEPPAPADLRDAFSFAPLGDGRYEAEVTADWNIVFVFGGVTMAMVAEAARVALDDPAQTLRSVNATFLQPVSAGPVELRTRVLRRGRSASQVLSELWMPGADGPALVAMVTLGSGEESELTYTDVHIPTDVVDPDEVPPPEVLRRGPMGPLPFHGQVEWRPAIAGFGWDDDWGPGPARAASWFRFGVPPIGPDGMLEPAAICVPGDVLGPAVGRRFGAWKEGRPSFMVISLTIALEYVGPAQPGWLLQHTFSQHAGAGYAIGSAEIWNRDGSLVALANQRARLRVMSPATDGSPAA